MAGALALRKFLEERRPRTAAVIGGGYIGLEVAEALRRRNVEVTVLERSATPLEDIEPEIGQWVSERLARHGVRVEFNAPVASLESGRSGVGVVGGARPARRGEVAVLAAGLAPRAERAAHAGVELGPSGAIRTDDRQQTNLLRSEERRVGKECRSR